MCKTSVTARIGTALSLLSVTVLAIGCQTSGSNRFVAINYEAKPAGETTLASHEAVQEMESSGEKAALFELPQVEGNIESNLEALIGLVDKQESVGRFELTLQGAIHIAMQNSETLRVIGGENGTVAAATIYDQPIENTGIQEEYGAFNTVFDWAMNWQRIDQPPGKTVDGIILNRNQLDRAQQEASLTKRFFSGGTGAIAYDTFYTFFPGPNPGGVLNPQYFTPLTFRFAQPLLQNKGREVNQAPIVIAQIESTQSTWDFKQAALDSVRDVESAYWQVYAAEIEVNALETVLPMFEEVVRINRERVEAEADAPVDADQAETNLWQAERNLIQAKLRQADALNLLRNLLGFPPSDRRELVLLAEPIHQSININWQETLGIAMQERPDIVRRRLGVKIRRLEKLLAENEKKIRLDGVAAWRINGLGSDLGDALSVLGDNDFTDWELGFLVNVPLGRDTAKAHLRAACLNYRREIALLQQTTHAATHDIAENLRTVNSYYEQIQAAEKELFYAEKWRDASRERYLNPALTGSKLADLNNYLLSLRSWSRAKSVVASRIGQYNTALASLEVATGTLLESRLVSLSFDCCRAATNILQTNSYNPPVGPQQLPPAETIVPEQVPANDGSANETPPNSDVE